MKQLFNTLKILYISTNKKDGYSRYKTKNTLYPRQRSINKNLLTD